MLSNRAFLLAVESRKCQVLPPFAAGAALCSTSLVTTFTILKTSGLTQRRLGIVLTSAAMMDDSVGLAIVQVISNLVSGDLSIDAVSVLRPVLASPALAVFVPLCCQLIVLPDGRLLKSAQPNSLVRLLHRNFERKFGHFCFSPLPC